MNNELFSYLLLSGPICGILMVLGGILLLYKGAISLNNAAEEALTVEFKKELRISTQYPALGIFVIGLLFVAVPAILGRPPEIKSLIIKASTVDIVEPVSIRLRAASWSSNLKHIGEIVETHRPNIDTMQVEISAPGHLPLTRTIQISSLRNGTADLGEIRLKQSLRISDLSGTIAAVPEHVSLPDLNSTAQFGGSK